MKRVHFMGIGGSGASSVAAIAQAQGFEISGCDKVIDNEFTKDFDKSILFEGHSAGHLKGEGERVKGKVKNNSDSISDSPTSDSSDPSDIDILAISPAITVYDQDNDELQAAKKQGLEVLTWQEFMGKYLEEGKFVIAVSGTHGKSTTTAMIGQILEDAELDPTVELGATANKWHKNYRLGKSKYFVTEADEYNNNFLVSHPELAVVLNIDYDHPDFFPTLDSYKQAFYNFMLQTKGTIVANLKDINVSDVLKNVMKHSKVSSVDFNKNEVGLNLRVPGEHYLSNAQAAFQVGILLGIEPQEIIKSLNNFSGIGRRLEVVGEINQAIVISSFGHHPTEIAADVEALIGRYPGKKLWMIFQPHLFSRTKMLFDNFVKVFRELPVERLAILDIYPSREKDPGDISSKQLVEAINKPNIKYDQSWEELKTKLEGAFDKNDMVLFIGAGDTDKWARELVQKP